MENHVLGLRVDDRLIDALRKDLEEADWTVETVDALLSPRAQAALQRDQLTPASVELAEILTPAATLTRFFILAEPVSVVDLQLALPTLGVDGAVRLGLAVSMEPSRHDRYPAPGTTSTDLMPVARPGNRPRPENPALGAGKDLRPRTVSGAQENPVLSEAAAGQTIYSGRDSDDPGISVRAAVDLRPHSATIPVFSGEGAMHENGEGATHEDVLHLNEHQWWVASDLSQAQTGDPPREDHVLGIASASMSLLRLTIRQSVDRALDLGCGCGILALYLSTHARHVVATDISERACQFTRFNAVLNRTDIAVRQGSLFDPVAGEAFDLITSNPPFVITPDAVRAQRNLEYRDGGMARDNLIPRVMNEAVLHLAAGGTLQMLANWEVGVEEDAWSSRPTLWVEEAVRPLLDAGGSAGAWIVQRDLVDVAQYAEWWMRDAWGDRVARSAWQAEYREWLRDFAAVGTQYVGLGFIALRVAGRQDASSSSATPVNVTPQRRVPDARKARQDRDPRRTPGSSPRAADVSTERSPEDAGASRESGRGEKSIAALGRLDLVAEYLPESRPMDGIAVSIALANLRIPDDWESLVFERQSDVREVRYYVPGSSDPELVRITQGRAGGRERTVTSAIAALVGVSDGELTPAQVIPAVALLLGTSDEDVRAELRDALPELLRSGVLVPHGSGTKISDSER